MTIDAWGSKYQSKKCRMLLYSQPNSTITACSPLSAAPHTRLPAVTLALPANLHDQCLQPAHLGPQLHILVGQQLGC